MKARADEAYKRAAVAIRQLAEIAKIMPGETGLQASRNLQAIRRVLDASTTPDKLRLWVCKCGQTAFLESEPGPCDYCGKVDWTPQE